MRRIKVSLSTVVTMQGKLKEEFEDLESQMEVQRDPSKRKYLFKVELFGFS